MTCATIFDGMDLSPTFLRQIIRDASQKLAALEPSTQDSLAERMAIAAQVADDVEQVDLSGLADAAAEVGRVLAEAGALIDTHLAAATAEMFPTVASHEVPSGDTQDGSVIADETQAASKQTTPSLQSGPASPNQTIVTGPWTAAEDLILLECFVEGTIEGAETGRLLQPVMDRLNRGQTDCMDRFALLVGGSQTERAMRAVLERTRVAQ